MNYPNGVSRPSKPNVIKLRTFLRASVPSCVRPTVHSCVRPCVCPWLSAFVCVHHSCPFPCVRSCVHLSIECRPQLNTRFQIVGDHLVSAGGQFVDVAATTSCGFILETANICDEYSTSSSRNFYPQFWQQALRVIGKS